MLKFADNAVEVGLEEERGLRLRPRCKNEPPVDEASHCLVQFRLGSLSDHRQQLV